MGVGGIHHVTKSNEWLGNSQPSNPYKSKNLSYTGRANHLTLVNNGILHIALRPREREIIFEYYCCSAPVGLNMHRDQSVNIRGNNIVMRYMILSLIWSDDGKGNFQRWLNVEST